MTNTNPVSDHEAAIINSSFSEWLLWVIVFTNTAIDIVSDITTGICAVIAIIGTFIKNKKILVDKVNYDMVNKATRYRKPVTVPKSPPPPEAVISTTRAAACPISTEYLCQSRGVTMDVEFREWISNLIYIKLWDIITNSRHNLTSGLVRYLGYCMCMYVSKYILEDIYMYIYI